MFFLLLIAMMIACLPLPWPRPIWGSAGPTAPVSVGISILGITLLAWWISFRTQRRLQAGITRRERIVRGYTIGRQLHVWLMLACYVMMLLLFGWGAWVHQHASTIVHGQRLLVPFGELLTLAPLFIMQFFSWLMFFSADRAFYITSTEPSARHPFWTRRRYLLFHVRQHAVLILLPLLFFITQQSMLRIDPRWNDTWWFRGVLFGAISVGLIVLPLLTVPILGLKSLPDGVTRSRLEGHATRLGMRYRGLLLWPTGNTVANAMLIGFVPRLRYVVFTDRLLNRLASDEVDAVFGHEVGHAHHRHFLTYMAFLVLSSLMMATAWNAIGLWLADDSTRMIRRYGSWILIPPIVLMGVYIFVVFGFLSRRCERQADLFGCRSLSCADPNCRSHEDSTTLAPGGRCLCPTGIRTFIRALEQVAISNGMSAMDGGGSTRRWRRWLQRALSWLRAWQHWPLARRIAYLNGVLDDMQRERQFQRRLARLKWFLVLMPLGVMGVMVSIWGWRILSFRV